MAETAEGSEDATEHHHRSCAACVGEATGERTGECGGEEGHPDGGATGQCSATEAKGHERRQRLQSRPKGEIAAQHGDPEAPDGDGGGGGHRKEGNERYYL